MGTRQRPSSPALDGSLDPELRVKVSGEKTKNSDPSGRQLRLAAQTGSSHPEKVPPKLQFIEQYTEYF